MATCQRCGRELKDPTARYGWRCAQILGYVDPWQYQTTYPEDTGRVQASDLRALRFLESIDMDYDQIDHKLYLQAFADLLNADYTGDSKKWESAFWRIVTALYPSFSDDGRRIPASVENYPMEVYLSLIQELDASGYMSFAQNTLGRNATIRSYAEGILPDYSMQPIKPLAVLENMITNTGDEGSFAFWTEPLDVLSGRSRMEMWTFPLDLEDLRRDKGISYNFRQDRSGRTHAGLDIHTTPSSNSPVYAVTDGIVVYQGWFYDSAIKKIPVYQVVVLNFDGSVVRYGEMHDRKIAAGTIVQQGDIAGYIKKMDSDEMLHIEVYSNADEFDQAFRYNLTDRYNKKYDAVAEIGYQRRGDLINPTMIGALGLFQ